MKKIAFYGGSFDPVHRGHLAIARNLTEIFEFDVFWLIPAFHAPHKKDKKITSPLCRYSMLALATNDDEKIKISTVELNAPEKPYTFETQTKLKNEFPDAEIFFVIGADSWNEIDTWREWQMVLTLTNIIVVTRPDYKVQFSQVSNKIRERVIDLRVQSPESRVQSKTEGQKNNNEMLSKNDNRQELSTQHSALSTKIYITDAIFIDVSSSEIRQKIRDNIANWREDVPREVAKYIEKYKLYI